MSAHGDILSFLHGPGGEAAVDAVLQPGRGLVHLGRSHRGDVAVDEAAVRAFVMHEPDAGVFGGFTREEVVELFAHVGSGGNGAERVGEDESRARGFGARRQDGDVAPVGRDVGGRIEDVSRFGAAVDDALLLPHAVGSAPDIDLAVVRMGRAGEDVERQIGGGAVVERLHSAGIALDPGQDRDEGLRCAAVLVFGADDHLVPVVVRILDLPEHDLLLVVYAACLPGAGPRLIQRRQQHGRQNRDNSYHN